MNELRVDPLIGKEIDGYQIETLLGQGGMARVYRALDVRLSRYAAIKVIDPQVRNPKAYHDRFDKEARAVAQLKHANIVTIYRFNEVDGLYYMAMEYVDGADLRWILTDHRNENKLMPHKTVLNIVNQVAKALDYSHGKGVIHRDIKPSNIMINRQGDAIITDFGLALLTDEGTRGETFGSPHYMSPEQAMNSATVVTQSDLYSLGVVVYEMLTGDVPFNEGSAMQIAMAHISDPPPDPTQLNPNLHPAFVPILQKALDKEPENRYTTGAKFVTDLRKAINEAAANESDPRFSRLKPEERIAQQVEPLPNIDTLDEAMAASPEVDTVSVPEKPAPPPETAQLGELMQAPKKAKNQPSITEPAHPERTSGRRLPVLLVVLLLIIVGGAGAFVALDPLNVNLLPSAVEGTAVTGVVEGEITLIDGNTLHLYGVPVQIGNQPFLSELTTGDMVRLEGQFSETLAGFIVQSLDATYIDGDLFEEEEPE